MSYGIEIKNVDNNAIIDGENPQFLIRGAGTANFGSIAGTGYGTIPNSGNSGNGMLLGSDFLFGVPYSSSGFSSTAYVHFEVLSPADLNGFRLRGRTRMGLHHQRHWLLTTALRCITQGGKLFLQRLNSHRLVLCTVSLHPRPFPRPFR